jgi:hypothetical protein
VKYDHVRRSTRIAPFVYRNRGSQENPSPKKIPNKKQVIHDRPFWNCRGIRKKCIASYNRDMVKECNFDFVCFQETITHEFSDECLRKLDPNKKFLWDWIPSKGRPGGVLSGFKIDRFDVGCTVLGNFMLHHTVWDKLLETKWCLMNVFGAAQEDSRQAFLSELASFCAKVKEPYMLGGRI